MNDAYLRRYRRMLLDMHIPDWDEGFLARYDPRSSCGVTSSRT
jgi:hypothetical protein